MLSKSQIKELRQLHQKKYRDAQRLFLAEGPKIVNELLKSGFHAQKIFGTKEYVSSGEHAQLINEKELQQISALTTPNQVVGIFEMDSPALKLNSLQGSLVFALDDIRDPVNLGTIIRIADWFGIDHILCSETCVDVYNPKVIQATMGSIARVQVHSVKLETILKELKPVYATVLNG